MKVCVSVPKRSRGWPSFLIMESSLSPICTTARPADTGAVGALGAVAACNLGLTPAAKAQQSNPSTNHGKRREATMPARMQTPRAAVNAAGTSLGFILAGPTFSRFINPST